jgi:anti-sigma B factor antagonist
MGQLAGRRYVNLIVEERADGIAVVRWGEPITLDASHVDELRDRVAEVERAHTRIVFEMSQLEFIDSSIVGALVGFLQRARAADGDVKLAGLTGDVVTIFELTRLNEVFRIHPSVEAAVQDFEAP